MRPPTLRIGMPLDPRAECHSDTLRAAGYDWMAIHTYRKAHNRHLGHCRCGAHPQSGLTARGQPYRTCARCLVADRRNRKRCLAAWKAIPRAVRVGITGMPFTPPRRSPPPVRTVRVYQRHVDELRKACEVEAPPAPPPRLTDQQRAFVAAYLANGRNGTRAAKEAGYGVESTARGGRAASVAASRLLRRANVQRAIATAEAATAETVRKQRLVRRVLRECERQRQAAALAARLEPMAQKCGPQSRAARLCRQLRGEPELPVPGHCRCGQPVSPSRASCVACRVTRRFYRRWHRAQSRPHVIPRVPRVRFRPPPLPRMPAA